MYSAARQRPFLGGIHHLEAVNNVSRVEETMQGQFWTYLNIPRRVHLSTCQQCLLAKDTVCKEPKFAETIKERLDSQSWALEVFLNFFNNKK